MPLKIETPPAQKDGSLRQSERAVNILDNHLYEKAMQQYEKRNAMENSTSSNHGDRLVEITPVILWHH